MEKECVFCKEMIYITKEKYVLLGTYNGVKTLDESYFHFQCFIRWHSQKVGEKAQNIIGDVTGRLVGKMKEIQSLN